MKQMILKQIGYNEKEDFAKIFSNKSFLLIIDEMEKLNSKWEI